MVYTNMQRLYKLVQNMLNWNSFLEENFFLLTKFQS